MKDIIFKYGNILIIASVACLVSCQEDWLDAKRNRQMIVPSTLKDLGLLLTDELKMSTNYISLMQISADDYYLDIIGYNALGTPNERNGYIWRSDIYGQQESLSDWDDSYNQVLTTNVILDGLKKIDQTKANSEEWNRIKGGALFFRAKAFYNLAQTFAKAYDPLTAPSDLGIPLRMSSDVNLPSVRSSVQETYDAILGDLKECIRLLPPVATFKTDASRAAAYALLARCYLSMGMYDNAGAYADSSLTESNTLINYNLLDPHTARPFSRFNAETIQFAQIRPVYGVFVYLRANYVPEDLYDSYDENDLRKALFFHDLGDGRHSFKGSYDGGITPFSGLAVDEMYLIRAECLARSGEVDAAMADLNTVLVNRFKTGTFAGISASSSAEALDIILLERRKELIGRGLRWSDLKRLNKDPEHAVTLSRNLDGTMYSLAPGDPRFVFSIPQYVIRKSGIEQNPR